MTHVYAGNPLNRGDHERRDEEWLDVNSKASTSKFLPLWENTVMIPIGSEAGLGWLNGDDIQRLGIEVEGVFLGLRNGTPHFVVDRKLTTPETPVLFIKYSLFVSLISRKTRVCSMFVPDSKCVKVGYNHNMLWISRTGRPINGRRQSEERDPAG